MVEYDPFEHIESKVTTEILTIPIPTTPTPTPTASGDSGGGSS